MPTDSTTILDDVTNLVQEGYYDVYLPQYERFGGVTRKLIKMSGEPVSGDGITFQNESRAYDSIRPSRVGISDFASPGEFVPTNIKVRWKENDASTNDFTKLSGSGSVSEFEVSGDTDKGTIIKIAKRVLDQLTEDYNLKWAMLQNTPRSGLCALVNGTKKQNDRENYTDCTAYSSAHTSMRVQVDGGQIAFFKPGLVFDFYTSGGTLRFSGAVVTDMNPTDLSVGFARYNDSSTANFDGVADNDEIYLSGARNQGMYGLEAWFTPPANTSDSFIGGANRTNQSYRWLNPTTYKVATSARQIQLADFNNMARAMSYQVENEHPVACVTTPEITDTLRTVIGNAAFIPWTQVGQEMQKRYASFGQIGLNFQHPAFGLISIQADPFAAPNKVRFVRSDTWIDLVYGRKGLKFMEGGDVGMWKRQPSTTAGNGFSMVYRCEAYAIHCAYCTQTWKNGQLTNVTA